MHPSDQAHAGSAKPTPSSTDISLDAPDHSKISFTAKLVAYARIYTDIPFAKDVSELVGAGKLIEDFAYEAHLGGKGAAWLVPLLEARYKSIVSAIQRSGIKQVLELASGVSLRGLAMTIADPQLTYVETDLPELTAEKLRLLKTLQDRRHLHMPGGYHVRSTNVLSWNDLEAATAPFNPKEPVVIVHEGLLMYLSHAEKDIAARNIHRLLERHGGLWITPDFSPIVNSDIVPSLSSPSLEQGIKAVVAKTGRDFVAASFKDRQEIEDFMSRLGFIASTRPQIDGSYDLSSAKLNEVSPKEMAKLKEELELWEVHCRSHA